MVYSFSLISLIIFISIYISNAIPLEDDKMLIAFMKGHQETQLSEYSMQKYEVHLGILYFMRINWQCNKIADEFEEHERTECQKYRKYLDILYEYLFREYVGISTVKPKFMFKDKIEIEGPIIYAIYCLAKISQFYFKSKRSNFYEYKLSKLYTFGAEPILLNKKRLNYELKLSINELILQLAIDAANEWQINESAERLIRQKFNKKFEENLGEMFKKAEEKAKKNGSEWRANINDDKHFIILHSKFDDKSTWKEDALFSELVKGLATNSVNFFKMAKEYSNYLLRMKEKGNINWFDERMIIFGLYEIEKMKKCLTQKYKAYLGVLYLMRVNWQCSNFIQKRAECQKFRKYLHILYEYLFRLYVQGKSNKLAHKLPAVKPIFMNYNYYPNQLISVVISLNEISIFFWAKDKNRFAHHKDYWKVFAFWKMVLVNEVELNYEIKEEENWFNKFKQNVLEKINGPKNVQKKGQNLNLSDEIEIANLRQEFEEKMEEMYTNWKEKAKLAKAKLDDKFDAFNSSPFL